MGNIVLKNVIKRFGETEVIPSLDLEIEDGEFVVFVGPSGCGKSTTLRMVAGLEVPAEALVSSMKEHQKYFHLVGEQGELKPNFITVANIESRDPAQVVAGNERVIRPRLSDAAFFFETDKKTRLEERVARAEERAARAEEEARIARRRSALRRNRRNTTGDQQRQNRDDPHDEH